MRPGQTVAELAEEVLSTTTRGLRTTRSGWKARRNGRSTTRSDHALGDTVAR